MWLGLALFAAASWGTADFLGGLAARRTPALRVLLVGLPAGLLLLLPFLLAEGGVRLLPGWRGGRRRALLVGWASRCCTGRWGSVR